MRVPLSKQCRYVTNHLHLVCNYLLHFCLHNYSFSACYVPYSCQCQSQYVLEYNNYNYCNIWSNKHRSEGPVFHKYQNIHSLSRRWLHDPVVCGTVGHVTGNCNKSREGKLEFQKTTTFTKCQIQQFCIDIYRIVTVYS